VDTGNDAPGYAKNQVLGNQLSKHSAVEFLGTAPGRDMPTYRVHFTADPDDLVPRIAELSSVEADDPQKAVEAMLAAVACPRCPACAGYSSWSEFKFAGAPMCK
jgi:hypothetical protein